MNVMYLFPYQLVERGSKVVLYGLGNVGMDYYRQIQETGYCSLIGVTSSDNSKINKERLKNIEVLSLDSLEEDVFDYIIVATVNVDYQYEILEQIKKYGICEEKIIFPQTTYRVKDVTYSQHGEDRIIYEAFKHMGYFKDGLLPSYIDVGAHHPYEISNTALFYQIGCHGINVEANPRLIELFNEERPGDINLCVGVGAEEGTFPFYITKYDGLNTFKKENISYNEFLSEQNTGIRESFEIIDVVDIKVKRLQDIILEYANGKWPEYMSIDIEGMEFEVLENTNLDNGPLLIVVEVNYEGDLFIELMKTKGYFPYIWYRENIIFIRKDMEKLVHAHTERE